MELKEFIQKTLTDIVEAIISANQKLDKDKPEKSFRLMKGYEGYLKDLQTKNPGFIDFDVAVTVKNEKEKSGKAGIQIIKVVEIGGLFGGKLSSEQVSRIKFSIGINKKIS